jgi:hypothetical protein
MGGLEPPIQLFCHVQLDGRVKPGHGEWRKTKGAGEIRRLFV